MSDAQDQYDQDVELQDLLARASESETVTKLRYFAERALACWEGSDADEAVETMNKAADLLDNN